jgi:hypothetical protein
LAIGLCRAIFFESRRFGSVFKFNGYLIFLITSSSSFFDENWFWSFGKFRIKEHVIAAFFLNSESKNLQLQVFLNKIGIIEPHLWFQFLQKAPKNQ